MADIVAELRECADLQTHEEWLFTRPKLLAAADEIERLRERCLAYKGQVESGAAEIERLRGVMKWVGEVYPAKNRESDGAIVHLTWDEFNRMRTTIGLREAPIPKKYGATVRVEKSVNANEEQ